jgi:dynein intermediate chain
VHLKDRPEYVFHCQSPVLSSKFAKFHPSLVVGSTYSGQLVLWDKRSKVPIASIIGESLLVTW